MNLNEVLDDDDILTLRRYRPFTNSGIDRVLTKVKQAVAAQRPPTRIVAVELPHDVYDWLAATDITFNDLGNSGAALNALVKAAKTS